MQISPRYFSKLAWALLVLLNPFSGHARPNILFIFTDDHATQAISAYGGMLADIAPTPNLDRIADEGMLLVDAENRQFVVANKAMCQMLGYDAEEITSLRVMDIHPKEDLDYVLGQFERQARGEMVLTKNIPVIKRDGSGLYADINSFPISMNARTYLISVFREIPARKGKSILQQIVYSDSYKGKPLTASEIRIFELIANGMSNKEIAHLLHRSVRTIEWHRSHIMRKLGVDSLADLVKKAASMGLVGLPANQRQDKYSATD